MDKYYVYRPILDLIGKSEGTDRGRGYNETLGYGAYTGGKVNLVGMTLKEIDALQTRMLAHPKNYLNSSALGRYQIVRTTLRKLRERYGLGGNLKFDKDLQDRLAIYLLSGRGLEKYFKGVMEENQILLELSKEWASLPKPDGRGYYGGQKASVSVAEVRRALGEMKAMYTNPPKPSKPVVNPIPTPETPTENFFISWLKKLFGIK